MSYLILTIISFLAFLLFEWVYIKMARKHKIYAPIFEHSVHSGNRVTTGGVLFVVAALCSLIPMGAAVPPWGRLMIGCSLGLAIISFIDDLWQMSVGGRLAVQILTVAAALTFIGVIDNCLVYICLLIGIVGYLNAMNFMDGADGMMGLTALVTLGALLAVMFVPDIAGIDLSDTWLATFTLLLAVAVVVFLIFNMALRPSIFAGDVGSVALGFYISFIGVDLMLITGEPSMVVFASVFITETFLTVLWRLSEGHNIFHSHRSHIYQLLIGGRRAAPRTLAIGYAAVQAAIDVAWMLTPDEWRRIMAICTFALLSLAFAMLRHRLIRHANFEHPQCH